MVKASNSCLKVKSYFKRYQVKPKRRRQGKTDYAARRVLIMQDKSKYGTPKFRLVARKTNKRIIAQLIYATMDGDRCVCEAHSGELARYGIKVGHTNYPAAYCTGLLLARRALKKFKLDEKFEGQLEVNGEMPEWMLEMEDDEGRGPLTAYLDVGLTRTTTGNNMFGVLKGAVDGGLNVPHSDSRFPGYDKEADDGVGELDADVHRGRIFGQHIAENMTRLEEEDPEAYKKQFSQYIKNGIKPDAMEDMYAAAHEAIRKDPSAAPKKPKQKGKSYKKSKKLTLEQRRANVQKKIASLLEQMES